MVVSLSGRELTSANNLAEVGSTTQTSIGDMLPRVLVCPFLRYSQLQHLKEAPLGFARG